MRPLLYTKPEDGNYGEDMLLIEVFFRLDIQVIPLISGIIQDEIEAMHQLSPEEVLVRSKLGVVRDLTVGNRYPIPHHRNAIKHKQGVDAVIPSQRKERLIRIQTLQPASHIIIDRNINVVPEIKRKRQLLFQ